MTRFVIAAAEASAIVRSVVGDCGEQARRSALYGRQHTHRPRLRMQFSAAAFLVATGTAVALSPQREWLIIPIVTVVTIAATYLSDALHWHPPGPLFPVFAVTACASVPTEPSRILIAFALAAGSAAFSLLIGASGLALPRARRLEATPWRASFRAAARPATRAAMLRFGAVVLVAGTIPTATGLGHPYWAIVSAVAAVSGVDAGARLVRAGHRMLGTIVGVLIAAALLAAPVPPLAVIAVVVLLQMSAELVVGRNYGITLAFVTPLAILMVELAHRTNELALLRDRALETALGVLVGVAATLIAQVASLNTQRRRQPRVRTGTSTARYCSPSRRPPRGGREWRAPRRNHSF